MHICIRMPYLASIVVVGTFRHPPPQPQSLTLAAQPENVRCDVAPFSPAHLFTLDNPVCTFALGIARDEPHHLLRRTHRTPLGTDVSWGQPPAVAMQRQLESRSAREYGQSVDLHMSASQLHAALRGADVSVRPPDRGVTLTLTLHAAPRLVSAAPAIRIANLTNGSLLALRFPNIEPFAEAARCGYWDVPAQRWMDAGLTTAVGGMTDGCGALREDGRRKGPLHFQAALFDARHRKAVPLRGLECRGRSAAAAVSLRRARRLPTQDSPCPLPQYHRQKNRSSHGLPTGLSPPLLPTDPPPHLSHSLNARSKADVSKCGGSRSVGPSLFRRRGTQFGQTMPCGGKYGGIAIQPLAETSWTPVPALG